MKLSIVSAKLPIVTAALLGSSMAMAATTAQPYQYNSNAGVLSNTAGAVTGTAKTLFDTATHPAAISAEIGTMGYGANIAWGVNESTELQAGWSGMNFDDKTELNANDSWINYEKALGDGYENFKGDFAYEADFSNPYLGVQMRPMNNWLTVGAGVMVPDNQFKAKLTPKAGGSSEVSINGETYKVPVGTSLDMSIENKNKLAPYATLGLRPNINNKWGAFVEAGAAYMGKIESDVKVVNGIVSTPTQLNANKKFIEEAKKELNDNDSIWYPIVKAGVTYRF